MGPHQFQCACLCQLINNCFTLFKKAVWFAGPFLNFFSKRLLLTFAMRWPWRKQKTLELGGWHVEVMCAHNFASQNNSDFNVWLMTSIFAKPCSFSGKHFLDKHCVIPKALDKQFYFLKKWFKFDCLKYCFISLNV